MLPPMDEQREMPLYQTLAHEVESAILSGSLASGDRLPSVRELSSRRGVSISTALQTYRHLENRRLIEARPKSGYFVSLKQRELQAPEPPAHTPRASLVGKSRYVMEVLAASRRADVVPFGAAVPSPNLCPSGKLQRLIAGALRRDASMIGVYPMSLGHPELQRQIARRSIDFGCRLQSEEIVVTNGAMEALSLALRAVARAGDTIALESPTFFGLLQLIESLGMKAIEIPTDPRNGISIDALDLATRKAGAVQACVIVSNFQNPLGSLMPDANKKRLVKLLAARDVALIEDDIYGELYFGTARPRVAKAWDEDGNVILCSSFSKCLAPGLRIGWMAPGKYLPKIEILKLITSISTAALPQVAIARFMADGGYDHHLRKLRRAFHDQTQRFAGAIARTFPPGARMSVPQGGYLLWVELPKRLDAHRLFEAALRESISIAPGGMFSNSERFNHYVRLNCGHAWSPPIERAIRRLGELVGALA
jgi:DNA-binding transcriptional MocR family regulator